MLKGEIAALGTACCWAFTGIFFAEAARRIGALRVNLLRLPTALVLLSGALVVTGTSFAALDSRRVGLLAASGVVGLTIATSASRFTTASMPSAVLEANRHTGQSAVPCLRR